MSLHTTELLDLLARIRAGDRAAQNQLILRTAARMTVMARVMLRRFPAVRAREETDDVVQDAAMRLLRTLEQLPVEDTRAFIGLIALHIRRSLLDLARRHRRRDDPPLHDDPDADLDRWAALHEAVERLPAELREVFSLRFYQGMTLSEIGATLGYSTATAHLRWHEAAARLADDVGELPG